MADPWLTREEYVALHQEMRGAMAELARLERACVLGVAAAGLRGGFCSRTAAMLGSE